MQIFDDNYVRNGYVSENFSLSLSCGKTQTQITMHLFNPIINTRGIPQTYSFLKKHFPSVLYTRCFNDKNLPFCKEVRSTEIGHLFEHILLESLCIEKLSLGFEKVVFNGRTRWNWIKEVRGVFHIVVDAGLNDIPILTSSLAKSINLTELILQTKSIPLYNAFQPTAVMPQPLSALAI